MWYRFVTDTRVRSYDRNRPDRFCAVTYLGEMYNYLRDHEQIIKAEAEMGPFAPSQLRRYVLEAYDEAGGVQNLVPRDPDDASRQLYNMAEFFRESGVTSSAGIRFVTQCACHFGQAGKEGTRYWTPEYENIGRNVQAYLTEATQNKSEPQLIRWAEKCLNEFVASQEAGVITDQDDELDRAVAAARLIYEAKHSKPFLLAEVDA